MKVLFMILKYLFQRLLLILRKGETRRLYKARLKYLNLPKIAPFQPQKDIRNSNLIYFLYT